MAWLLLIQTPVSYELNLTTPKSPPDKMKREFHLREVNMDLQKEMTIIRNLKNEMRAIRQRIDKEKNPTKKTEMVKAYRKMSKALS